MGMFASVMGIVGLGLAWRGAAETFPISRALGEGIIALGICVKCVLGLAYSLKIALHPAVVQEEFRHPEQTHLFATAPIAAMLIAVALYPYSRGMAGALFIPAALLTCALTVLIVSRWLTQRQSIECVNPSWFLAVMGNIVAPIAGIQLGYHELSWMLFTTGILFWPPLLAIIFFRLMFHGPLPGRLAPTFFILLGPPTAGFIAYVELTGGIDGFARSLFYSGVFFALLVAALSRTLVGIPFSASWWAFTFPLDALALCLLYYYREIDAAMAATAFFVTLALATFFTLLVSVLTVLALIRGTPLVPLTDAAGARARAAQTSEPAAAHDD